MAEESRQLYESIQELLDSKSLDAIKLILPDHRESEIAEVVELLDNDERIALLDLMDTEMSAEVLTKVDEATRHAIFDKIKESKLTPIIEELDADDAADVLAELPDEQIDEILKELPTDEAEQIINLMRYSEDSAGGIMDPVLISVQQDATVKEAINQIQIAEIDEDFFSVFVTDRQGKFIGDVRIRSLLTHPEGTKIDELVDTDAIYIMADTDQEEVRNIFKKNDLITAPVLNKSQRLVGRITADRIIEVAEEEAAEDVYTMAGTDAAELENFSVVHAARVRMTWLLPCLAGTAVTAVVGLVFVGVYIRSGNFDMWAVAMVFAPMIAAISGNAGLQTSAIVVCGLATGDLAALRIGQVFAREVRIAFLVAISCGIVGGGIRGILPRVIDINKLIDPVAAVEAGPAANSIEVSASDANSETAHDFDATSHIRFIIAFSAAMFVAIMVATTLGLFLPFLFRKVGIDPAISSGPLVTTANDSISVAIYLMLTFLLIH